MKSLVTALQFLTLLRISSEQNITMAGLARSMAAFPLVGALQGLVLMGAYWLAGGVLPWSVVAALALCLLVLSNGGLHLDGFADTVDGLAGGANPEDRLRIMRDSATGAIGAAFVVLLLILKYAALSAAPEPLRYGALFAFPVAGRWSMVPLSFRSRYARASGGLGSAFSGVSLPTVVTATVIALILCYAALGTAGVYACALVLASAVFVSLLFKRKLGGITGDVFGFQSEVAETIFLVSILALNNLPAVL